MLNPIAEEGRGRREGAVIFEQDTVLKRLAKLAQHSRGFKDMDLIDSIRLGLTSTL